MSMTIAHSHYLEYSGSRLMWTLFCIVKQITLHMTSWSYKTNDYTVKLGYNELGYNELSAIANKNV
jgi:hypothetical protein